jgi:hypothetical protein
MDDYTNTWQWTLHQSKYFGVLNKVLSFTSSRQQSQDTRMNQMWRATVLHYSAISKPYQILRSRQGLGSCYAGIISDAAYLAPSDAHFKEHTADKWCK